MKILYVDDDEGLLYLARHTLEEQSFHVTLCLDSTEVPDLLQSNDYDVVVLDQEMPKMNGLEVIKQTRWIEAVPPIIMVTGAGNEVVAVEAIRLGASDYVVKDTNLVYLKILPSVIRQVIHERELTQKQQAAQRALQEEKDRARLLTQFIRDASHEFRTPLSIIHTSSELLRRMVTESKHQDYIERIQEQSNRILSLVDGLITLAKLDNISVLNLLPVNLNVLISNTVENKRNVLTDKGIHIQAELGNEPVIIMADAPELTAALAELIDNAYRASHPDSTIYLSVHTDHTTAVITLRDEGIGMSGEQISHIFERFYRVDEAHTTPGFGLGLPIAARIIDLHHGDISITSEPTAGTTVIVTLPIA
jgi:signal transduction histidine kinase